MKISQAKVYMPDKESKKESSFLDSLMPEQMCILELQKTELKQIYRVGTLFLNSSDNSTTPLLRQIHNYHQVFKIGWEAFQH